MNYPLISCCIPAKNANDPLLKELIDSIKDQDYPQDKIEIIVETRGDSESAKAMAILRSKGDICAMFCADNFIVEKDLFRRVADKFAENGVLSAVYPDKYAYIKGDNSLNRYFSLIGGNDPVCYFLGKNDRHPHVEALKIESEYQPSYGCNGFFYKASDVKQTNLGHYYPMDNASEVEGLIKSFDSQAIWHRTSDKLIPFLKKRYKYARELYCDRGDRRWKMVDTREDKWRLALFVISSLTVIPALFTSFKGFSKIRDWAWFWHWPASFGILITYGILVCRNLLRHRSLFQRSADPTVSGAH